MTPDVVSAVAASLVDAPSDATTGALSECERALASLRQKGAHQYKPVDFHYMEALARRMGNQAPNVQGILQAKLQQAMAAYQAEFEETKRVAIEVKRHTASTHAPKPTSLGQLVRSMAQHTPAPETSSWHAPSGARTELNSVRNFRNTWSKLSAQKQVAQALGQAPKNAGPINSHMLVLRSLELMRDISPDYLNRFMSYADTLLCLDQSDLSAKAPPAKPKPLASAKPKARPPARS